MTILPVFLSRSAWRDYSLQLIITNLGSRGLDTLGIDVRTLAWCDRM